MVMSKVSKAIAASFLCLLFNASGNVTNAMEDNTNPEYNVLNKVEEKESDNDSDSGADNTKDKDDKTPDGEKSIWRWLLPVITGVGGTTVGIVLGKFAF